MASVACVFALIYVAWLWVDTPDVTHLKTQRPSTTALMWLRERERAPQARLLPEDWIPVEHMPLLACAVVKAEDRMFFRHGGFDWHETRVALWQAWRTGHLRGASTMTAQLARTLFLSPERSLERKLREAFLVQDLEKALSKRDILELYLNTIEWGDGVYGAADAARQYFGKPPDVLDPFEAATLASLIPAPGAPLVGKNLDRFNRSHARVLRQLYRSRIITQEERDAAEASRRTGLSDAATTPWPTHHAWVPRHDLMPFLDQECGLEDELANRRH
ncbi:MULTISPECIES: biosynthetic peptidoglycan transglycosylase [unclassified Corallococcus]|uniref:biosynthetic peptidoglycan transglycosylase n=1 Tax=Corallococcus TaxID=83461 RepID=UPI001CBCC060|nr:MULTISPECIES: biosynthetic peptidoglycan transglycosylase [unclassified Corallococcus]MBZ4330217.1 transglycosylase domain-containing protein [Corallococcus sp. AS-1-12]MBZ4373754.1 transglycosylase domain-containing protein [Corallococcus sp. AS-1-6]